MLSKVSNHCIALPLSTCIHVFQGINQVWPTKKKERKKSGPT